MTGGLFSTTSQTKCINRFPTNPKRWRTTEHVAPQNMWVKEYGSNTCFDACCILFVSEFHNGLRLQEQPHVVKRPTETTLLCNCCLDLTSTRTERRGISLGAVFRSPSSRVAPSGYARCRKVFTHRDNKCSALLSCVLRRFVHPRILLKFHR